MFFVSAKVVLFHYITIKQVDFLIKLGKKSWQEKLLYPIFMLFLQHD